MYVTKSPDRVHFSSHYTGKEDAAIEEEEGLAMTSLQAKTSLTRNTTFTLSRQKKTPGGSVKNFYQSWTTGPLWKTSSNTTRVGFPSTLSTGMR